MPRKQTVYDLHDDIIDYNDDRLKKLKDNKEVIIEPSVKMALRMSKKKSKEAEEAVESLNLDSLEAKLSMIAKEKQKAEKIVEKAKKQEDGLKFKKAKKKKKKEQEQKIRLMFSATPDTVEEGDEGEAATKLEVVKNKLVKDTAGTILDSNIGKRFAPLYKMQIEDYERINFILKDLEDDLKTSPSKNMYRSSQTSNLLTALGQKRTLLKDMTDMAKTVSDLELKYAKEERSTKEASGNDDQLAARIGSSIVRGLYDDVFEETIKKKKKSKKKNDEDDDDDDEIDFDSKKDASNFLAKRIAKEVIFSDYEKNIDIEGEYNICVLADKDEPEKEWKFIITDEDGERRKDWEKERPELLPNKKNSKMKFKLDKMKAYDRGRKYELILK